MNKKAFRMLKEAGLHKVFFIMLMLRLPFDTLNSIFSANMIQSFTEIIQKNETNRLWRNVLLFLLFSLLLFGYNMLIWSTISVKTGVKMQKKFRLRVFDAISELTPWELSNRFGADWFTRINSDVDKACNYLTGAVNYIHKMIAILNVLVTSVIMLFINSELFLIGIACLLPFFFLNVLLIAPKISVFRKKGQEMLAEYTNWIDVAQKNQEVIKVFDGTEFIRKKMEESSIRFQNENNKANRRAALSEFTGAVSGMLGYLLILLRGNEIINEGLLDYSTLNKMTQYRGQIVKSVNMIYNCVNNMKGNFAGVERINEIKNKKMKHQIGGQYGLRINENR